MNRFVVVQINARQNLWPAAMSTGEKSMQFEVVRLRANLMRTLLGKQRFALFF